jgi:hypothetical protein
MLQVTRYDYTPILGWSSSRYDKFRSCKRQYYYHYYGKYDPEYPRIQIDRLKKLTSIPLEIGSITHQVIVAVLERLLRSKSTIDADRFERFVERKTELACRSGEFFEAHYAEREQVLKEDLLPDVRQCLESLLSSDRFGWIRDRALAEGNEWLIEPPGYGEARLEGYKIYCKVDFLFLVDGRATILDWKTGKRHERKHRDQLLGYSVWAMSQLGVTPRKIHPFVAYLRPRYDEIGLRPTRKMLEDFSSRIIAETEQMYRFCSNYIQNVPLEKDAFPMVEQSAYCRYCSFKELCGRV